MGANERVAERIENQQKAFEKLKEVFADEKQWQYLDDLRYWYLENNSEVARWRVNIAQGIKKATKTLLSEDTVKEVNRMIDTLNRRIEGINAAATSDDFNRYRSLIKSGYRGLKGRLEREEKTAYDMIEQSQELTRLRDELIEANRLVAKWKQAHRKSSASYKEQLQKAKELVRALDNAYSLFKGRYEAIATDGYFIYDFASESTLAREISERVIDFYSRDGDARRATEQIVSLYDDVLSDKGRDELRVILMDCLQDRDSSEEIRQKIEARMRELDNEGKGDLELLKTGEHEENYPFDNLVEFPEFEIEPISRFVNIEIGLPKDLAEELTSYARGSYQVTLAHAERINELATEFGTPSLEVEPLATKKRVDENKGLVEQAIMACDLLIDAMESFKKGGAGNSTQGGQSFIKNFKKRVRELRATLRLTTKGVTGESTEAFKALEEEYRILYEWVENSFFQFGGAPDGESHLSKAQKARYNVTF